MSKYPKRGIDVTASVKFRDVAPKKKAGPKLHVELFSCPERETKFHAATKT